MFRISHFLQGLLVVIVLIVSPQVKAGKLEKAFDALKVYNYFEAKSLFEKALKSDNTGASYGLSLIYSNDKNPFFQLDSARKYILQAEVGITGESEKDLLMLAIFEVNAATIVKQKNNVGELAFLAARKQMKLEPLNHFILNYSYSDRYPRAIEIRDSLAFEQALSENGYEVYFNFMNDYPTSSLFEKAKGLYEIRLYQQLTAGSTLGEYESFVKKYKENPYVPQAMDSIYSIFITENSVENYYAFIKNYPGNKNVSDAWRTLYKLYNREDSKERIVEFQIDFPDYPFIDEVLVDYELSEIRYLQVKEGDYWGFINDKGMTMVPCIYDWVEDFKEGLAMVGKDFKVGFINKAGRLVIPLVYDEAETFKQGYSIVSKNDKYGMINKANLVEIPMVYDEMNEFSQGLSSVMTGGKYTYIDVKGREIIKTPYDYAGDFENGFAYVEQDGKRGIIDINGKVVVPVEFDWLENFTMGLARVRNEDKFGLYNDKGELILPIEYDNIGSMNSNRIMVAKEDKYGYVDAMGVEKIALEYEFNREALAWSTFEKGVVKIKKHKLMGLIDTTGKKLLPAIFEDLLADYSALIPVRKRGLWGYCDKNVNLVIKYQYNEVSPFSDKKAIAKKGEFYGLIDNSDKVIVPFLYDEINVLDGGLLKVKKDGLFGIVDFTNEVLFEPSCVEIQHVHGEYLQLRYDTSMTWVHIPDRKIIWTSNIMGE